MFNQFNSFHFTKVKEEEEKEEEEDPTPIIINPFQTNSL